MLFSQSLLKRYIALNQSAEIIGREMTHKTCEIEGITQRKIPELVVIGKATKVEKHPEADKLFVCQIDCGSRGIFQILTGGENIVEGAFVPAALPGCYLPVIDLSIAERKMRGLDSNGMICSKGELGINEDEDQHWIWVLQHGDQGDFSDISDADLGKSLGEKYPRLENIIFEVDNKNLTNRPDLTGHFGIAIELKALFAQEPKSLIFDSVSPLLQERAVTNPVEAISNGNQASRKVELQSSGARSYILGEIENVSVSKSDFLTRLLMIDIGQTPKNNRVDFSNLFMALAGQPIHFFDAAKVNGNIIVRDAKTGEKFTDLLGVEHSLDAQDIVITDSEKILALAGVMGGQNSAITNSTKNILVEIANFDPVRVRKTGTRLGLRTDAELKFEKNINPVFSLYSLFLFMNELKYFAKNLGNYEIKGFYSALSSETQAQFSAPRTIKLSRKKLHTTLFGNMREDLEMQLVGILENIGCKVISQDDELSCQIPWWRGPTDLTIPEDMIEEVARIYGYNRIEGKMQTGQVEFIPFSTAVKTLRKIEETLIEQCHYDQVETYPRAEKNRLDLFETDTATLYELQNPTAPEMSYMRDKLIYNLLDYTAKNAKFFDQVQLFDYGKIWKKNPDQSASDRGERVQLGIVRYQKNNKNWEKDSFLILKGECSLLLKKIGLTGKVSYESADISLNHPKKQAKILYEGKGIGFVSQIHPTILEAYKMELNSQLAYACFDMTTVHELLEQKVTIINQIKYETLQDQIVYRDLCFVLDENQHFSSVLEPIKALPQIEEIEIFDLYQGENLPQGKKSVALTMKIKGDGSLTTDQINEIMNSAIKEAEKNGGQLR
ncbi:MAG TPA: phenylalanine--tRNA ligase subunit beta [Candidatus Absconditabacterales bacterium]|nr:phenylalanine--tRNA ligase subunit beta [Candidatus Absconditabacterales bacterium]